MPALAAALKDAKSRRLNIVLVLRAFLNVLDTVTDLAWLITIARFTSRRSSAESQEDEFFSQEEAAAVFTASLVFLLFETACQIIFTTDFSLPKNLYFFRKIFLKILHVEQVFSLRHLLPGCLFERFFFLQVFETYLSIRDGEMRPSLANARTIDTLFETFPQSVLQYYVILNFLDGSPSSKLAEVGLGVGCSVVPFRPGRNFNIVEPVFSLFSPCQAGLLAQASLMLAVGSIALTLNDFSRLAWPAMRPWPWSVVILLQSLLDVLCHLQLARMGMIFTWLVAQCRDGGASGPRSGSPVFGILLGVFVQMFLWVVVNCWLQGWLRRTVEKQDDNERNLSSQEPQEEEGDVPLRVTERHRKSTFVKRVQGKRCATFRFLFAGVFFSFITDLPIVFLSPLSKKFQRFRRAIARDSENGPSGASISTAKAATIFKLRHDTPMVVVKARAIVLGLSALLLQLGIASAAYQCTVENYQQLDASSWNAAMLFASNGQRFGPTGGDLVLPPLTPTTTGARLVPVESFAVTTFARLNEFGFFFSFLLFPLKLLFFFGLVTRRLQNPTRSLPSMFQCGRIDCCFPVRKCCPRLFMDGGISGAATRRSNRSGTDMFKQRQAHSEDSTPSSSSYAKQSRMTKKEKSAKKEIEMEILSEHQ